jgi:UDP-N-acetylglucosamine--N-acetylmuramyl-(pentapeptide) pyrophosphoryl-undecaprenol N-acetylglucosamine transferase
MTSIKNVSASSALGTVLIMAGGTGGHVFPALSIARNLQERGYRTEWLGTEAGIEAQVLAGTDIPLHCIEARGLRGKNLVSLLTAPFMILHAIKQAMRVVRKVKPCCVLGMGGYVTGPGGVAARLLGKPLLIHEQNAIAGFTNRLLARLAVRVMEAFPDTFAASKKVICTGNPVRKEIALIGDQPRSKSESNDALRVLILGGSLGAVAINRLIPETLKALAHGARLEIFHQAGKNNLEQTLSAYADCEIAVNEQCKVVPFIDNMAAAYRWADLVICRAGAATISELAAAGRASILVPFPYAVDDHQTRNAQSLSEFGAAILMPQSSLDADKLASVLTRLMANRNELNDMADKAKQTAKMNACDMVTNECIGVCLSD